MAYQTRTVTIKPPPSHVQLPLLEVAPDKPISRAGEARTRYGKIVEEVVQSLLGLEDIPNSGTHDCVFDAYHRRSGTYCEIKSLRKKNKCPIYDWRRTKDREAGVPLAYIFGLHECSGEKSIADVLARMQDTLNVLLVLPHWAVDLEARKHPLHQIKSTLTASGERNGYQRKGYREGYRNIPYDRLYDIAKRGNLSLGNSLVHGREFVSNILFHPAIEPWV